MRIGATITFNNNLATILAAKFLQDHPEARTQLQVHNAGTILQEIANHELDLGLIEGDCKHPDIEVQPWIADELVIFCAQSHVLANQAKVTLDQLLV